MKPQPKCVIITGRPGSGKTTLSGKLSKLLHVPLLSRDEIKEGFVNSFGISHDQLPADTNGKVNNIFFSTAQMMLEGGVSILVEAAFQHKVWEQVVPHWAQASSLYFIVCETDPLLSARRHLDRGLNDASRGFYHGDKRVQVFKETGQFLGAGEYTPPAFDLPTLKVLTTDGYSPDLAFIKNFIFPETD